MITNKCRAWFPIAKRLIYFENPEVDDEYDRLAFIMSEGQGTIQYHHLAGDSLLPDEPFVLTWFTGLHDKNGKEIYERDIARQHFAKEWWQGEISISSTQGTTVSGKGAWPHDIEVIGNIFENPELRVDQITK